jgi:AcrR family transcriptional regulator
MTRDNTRLVILEAAVKLFAQKGFDRATVDEVAAEANTAKGTIFYNFKSKDDIFRAILEKNAAEFDETVIQRSAGGGSASVRMEAAVDAAFDFFQGHHSFTSLLVSELGRLRSRWGGGTPIPLLDVFRRRIEEIYAEGQRSGEFRRDVEASDLGLIVFVLAAVITMGWRLHDEHTLESRVVRNSKLIFLKGLRAD